MPEQSSSDDEDRKSANLRLKPKKSQVSEEIQLANQLAESLGGVLIDEGAAGTIVKTIGKTLPKIADDASKIPNIASDLEKVFTSDKPVLNLMKNLPRKPAMSDKRSLRFVRGSSETPSITAPKIITKPKAAAEVPTIEPKPAPKPPKTPEPVTTPKPKTAPETSPKPQTTPKDLPIGIDTDTGILKKVKPTGRSIIIPGKATSTATEPKTAAQPEKISKRNKIRTAVGSGARTKTTFGGGGIDLPDLNIPSLKGPRQGSGNIYQAISL